MNPLSEDPLLLIMCKKCQMISEVRLSDSDRCHYENDKMYLAVANAKIV